MQNTRFTWQFLLWLVAYGVVLFASIAFVQGHMGSPWRYPVSLLPMIPVAFVARTCVLRLSALDELEKRIQLTALSVTVLVAAIVTFSYGFLENVGFPRVSMFWVWPLMGLTWGIAGFFARRQYE